MPFDANAENLLNLLHSHPFQLSNLIIPVPGFNSSTPVALLPARLDPSTLIISTEGYSITWLELTKKLTAQSVQEGAVDLSDNLQKFRIAPENPEDREIEIKEELRGVDEKVLASRFHRTANKPMHGSECWPSSLHQKKISSLPPDIEELLCKAEEEELEQDNSDRNKIQSIRALLNEKKSETKPNNKGALDAQSLVGDVVERETKFAAKEGSYDAVSERVIRSQLHLELLKAEQTKKLSKFKSEMKNSKSTSRQ